MDSVQKRRKLLWLNPGNPIKVFPFNHHHHFYLTVPGFMSPRSSSFCMGQLFWCVHGDMKKMCAMRQIKMSNIVLNSLNEALEKGVKPNEGNNATQGNVIYQQNSCHCKCPSVVAKVVNPCKCSLRHDFSLLNIKSSDIVLEMIFIMFFLFLQKWKYERALWETETWFPSVHAWHNSIRTSSKRSECFCWITFCWLFYDTCRMSQR